MNQNSDTLRKIARQKGVEARNGLLPDERKSLSSEITEQIINSEEFLQAKTIMVYRAINGEVSLYSLIEAPVSREKIFVYPFCVNKTEMLALYPHGADSWKKGSYGIMEPSPEMSDQIDPADIDMVICPCTTFDEECNRMGMGAGYYDRFLPKCTKAVIASVAFEAQKISKVPSNSHDKPMDLTYTEKTIYRNNIL